MSDQFRALCAELIDDLELCDLLFWPYKLKDTIRADIERARALLAEPEVAWEPMPLPGDAEGLAEVFWAEPEAEGPTDEELETFLVDVACQNGDMYYADPKVLARAVLARWGRPTPQPVAVSERLPGLDVKCWWFDSTKQWYFRSWKEINIAGLKQPTHWLPANALPLPTPETTND